MEKTNNLHHYHKYRKKKLIIILILCLILLLLMILSLMVGSTKMGLINMIKAFLGKGESSDTIIIWQIRMPRMLAGVIAGSGLALAGCIMQTILKNPMASPTTLGVSNGAVFGANLAIIVLGCGAISTTQGININLNNPYLTTICAFVFAILSALIILLLARKSKYSAEVVVLAGVALGSLFSAGTTIIQYFADDTKLSSAIFWTFGDLNNATYVENLIMFIIIIVAFVYFYLMRFAYNSLTSGEDVATSLGINVKKIRFISLLLSSLICAVCVAFLGIIGFIGLIAPHIAKKLVGSDHGYLLISAMLIGSIILLVADFLAKILIKQVSLPIGAITSLFGAPLFLMLLIKGKRGGYNA